MQRLSQVVRPGQRIAVVVSDITRPCPTARLLPPLLSELGAGGIEEGDIRVIFALKIPFLGDQPFAYYRNIFQARYRFHLSHPYRDHYAAEKDRQGRDRAD